MDSDLIWLEGPVYETDTHVFQICTLLHRRFSKIRSFRNHLIRKSVLVRRWTKGQTFYREKTFKGSFVKVLPSFCVQIRRRNGSFAYIGPSLKFLPIESPIVAYHEGKVFTCEDKKYVSRIDIKTKKRLSIPVNFRLKVRYCDESNLFVEKGSIVYRFSFSTLKKTKLGKKFDKQLYCRESNCFHWKDGFVVGFEKCLSGISNGKGTMICFSNGRVFNFPKEDFVSDEIVDSENKFSFDSVNCFWEAMILNHRVYTEFGEYEFGKKIRFACNSFVVLEENNGRQYLRPLNMDVLVIRQEEFECMGEYKSVENSA